MEQQSGWTRVSVRRTHLELRRPEELRPARPPTQPMRLVLRRPISAAEYLELYGLVGDLWLWRDRLVWDTRALIQKETHPNDPAGVDAVSVEATYDTAGMEVTVGAVPRDAVEGAGG